MFSSPALFSIHLEVGDMGRLKNWRNWIRIGRAWTFKDKNVWINGWNIKWKVYMKIKGGYKTYYGSFIECIKVAYRYKYDKPL
jgi:hypothetical protein